MIYLLQVFVVATILLIWNLACPYTAAMVHAMPWRQWIAIGAVFIAVNASGGIARMLCWLAVAISEKLERE